MIMVVAHFTPIERTNYRIGLPRPGFWREILNTNSSFYGGSNSGNGSGLASEDYPFDDLPQSAEFTLPPCSTMIFKLEG
jgi:1,4-alpha-glucan branching enzyme